MKYIIKLFPKKVLFISILGFVLMFLGACGGREKEKEDVEYIESIDISAQLGVTNVITSIPENSPYYYEEEKVNRDIPEALEFMNIGQPYYNSDNGVFVVPDNNIFGMRLKEMEKTTNVEKEEMEDFYWMYYATDVQHPYRGDYISLYYNVWHELEKVEYSYEFNDINCGKGYELLFLYADYYGEDYEITEDGNFIWKVNNQEICLVWNYEDMCPKYVSIMNLE